MKKLISVILSLVMLLGLAVPAFAAGEEAEYPVVYIEGQGIGLVRDGESIYPLKADILDTVLENIKPLLKQVAVGAIVGDYSGYTEELYNVMAPIYEDVKLGKDGLPTDNSRPSNPWKGNVSSIYTSLPVSGGSYPVYRWHYDWRLSPIVLAEELNEIVDAVLAKTGAAKVNIVSRCLGTNIAYAYLSNEDYGAADKVNSCVFYASALEGIGAADALFSGNIKLDAGAVDRFLAYYQDAKDITIGDDATTQFILTLVEFFEEVKVLGVGLDALENMVNKIVADAVPEILKVSYGTFPAYWSMVSAGCYEKAKNFVFPTKADKEEWAGLIAQTDAYYEIEKNIDETLLALSDRIHFAVISKYGFPCFPLTADAGQESDAFVTVPRAAFGAKAADLDKKLSSAYISNAKANGTDKYISADGKIDASTALFPDTSWFIKDLEHKAFPDCVNDLIIEFINSNGEMTVFSNPSFTQYLQFNALNDATSDGSRGTVSPINTAADTEDNTQKYAQSPLQAIIRFLRSFFEFIKKLFVK